MYFPIKILFFMLSLMNPQPENKKDFYINWKRLPSLPALKKDATQIGLSGSIIGNIGEKLIFAGGTNFKGEKPWRGGIKSYYDDVYILTKGEDNTFKWSICDQKLPSPLAYSSCISTSKGIVVIGGENHIGVSNNVFLIHEINNKLTFQNLISLPFPLSNSCAVVDNSKIYLAGGNDNKNALTSFLFIDIAECSPVWRCLPDLPYPVSYAYLALQSDGEEKCIYLFGGRNKSSDSTIFYSSVWKYKPSKAIWQNEGNIIKDKDRICLSAGSCVSYKDKYIILLGGDQGVLYKKIERLNNQIVTSSNYEEKQNQTTIKDKILSSHPGFYKEILLYNTLLKEWRMISEFPDPIPVTTSAIIWEKNIFILGGEIKPGVRTSNVYCGEIFSQ